MAGAGMGGRGPEVFCCRVRARRRVALGPHGRKRKHDGSSETSRSCSGWRVLRISHLHGRGVRDGRVGRGRRGSVCLWQRNAAVVGTTLGGRRREGKGGER